MVQLDAVTVGDAALGDTTGTVTIRDSDGIAGADPVLLVSDAQIREGDADGPRTVQIQAQLDRPLGADLRLQWRTVDGSAVSTLSGDFKARGTVVKPITSVIRAGKLFAVFTVTLYPDASVEGDEDLTIPVTVQGGSPVVSVVDGVGTITLINDDT